MLPALALVGRPNVGKSTLFNRLTRTRDAIVDDQPGVTRDRLYGRGEHLGKRFLAVDTGGLADAGEHAFADGVRLQVEAAVSDAQAVLFLTDATDGLTAADRDIAEQLRRADAKVFVLVNKSEGVDAEVAAAEFQALGLGAPTAVSAKRGDGVDELLTVVLADTAADDTDDTDDAPVFTLAGRPNVGKSTLANKLAGESRVLVADTPGTTRDSVRVPVTVDGRRIILIDTAGVRKKSRVDETLEKFSVIKALQSVERASVVILMLDATGEIGFQDATIAGMIRDLGRSIVVAVNKWDRLPDRQRKKIRDELARKLPFLPDPEILFISARHGSGVGEVMPAALRAHAAAMAELNTAGLNRTLGKAVAQTPPPMQRGRAVKLKFAHQAGKNPPVIIVHGNAAKLPAAYQRYLARAFARAHNLVGTPVRIIPRTADNPYANPAKRKRK